MIKSDRDTPDVQSSGKVKEDSTFDKERKSTTDESVSLFFESTPFDEMLHTREIKPYETCCFRILVALRRMMHFVDAYSKKLAVEHHITGPQLICLYSIVKEGPLTLSALGKQVSLSMSTVNGIVDRLDYKGLAIRERKDRDRRKVLITATDAGKKLAAQAPLPFQDRLAQAIERLPELEQVSIALSFERVVEMMEEKIYTLSLDDTLVNNGSQV